MIEKLYEEYGRLMVQLEAINNGIIRVKQKITEEIKKQPSKQKVDKG